MLSKYDVELKDIEGVSAAFRIECVASAPDQLPSKENNATDSPPPTRTFNRGQVYVDRVGSFASPLQSRTPIESSRVSTARKTSP